MKTIIGVNGACGRMGQRILVEPQHRGHDRLRRTGKRDGTPAGGGGKKQTRQFRRWARPMKTGTMRSRWRYDAILCAARQFSDLQRRMIVRYAPGS